MFMAAATTAAPPPPTPRRRRTLRGRRRGVPSVAATAVAVLWAAAFLLASPRSLRAAPTTEKSSPESYDNVLFILLDQLRYDALGFVQRGLSQYRNKVTIRTPNIDSLASHGVSFSTAYSQSPGCGPARATVKTGRTVAHHGIVGNQIIEPRVYNLMAPFRERITNLTTFEEILRTSMNYRVETYGKWHFPALYYDPVTYNDYSYAAGRFDFRTDQVFSPLYAEALRDLRSMNVLGPAMWKAGDQANGYNGGLYPYTPLPTDPRFGRPANTSELALPGWLRGRQLGVDSLGTNFTSTSVVADMALRALDRIMKAQAAARGAAASSPFLLSVHFNAPHPPLIVTNSYLRYYQLRKQQLFVPPSLLDAGNDSPYPDKSPHRSDPRYLYTNATFVKDMTSVYYAMVEEVDAHIGAIVGRLNQDPEIANRTLIVFTSDHGEMMGSHGRVGKGNLYEESTRVPLILVHPTKIAPGQVVKDAITHLDLFSTLLDYSVGTDTGPGNDGASLRRYVDRTAYNEDFDEGAVVIETHSLTPTSATTFNGVLGSSPNFMVRRGAYKLVTTRLATGTAVDALWDLNSDPHEVNNLLKSAPNAASVIGKAEHLKILLVEWLVRHDTEMRVYTSNYYHLGQGRGDVKEVSSRRTWKRLKFWLSDASLGFGVPIQVGDNNEYRRNEYLYVGGQEVSVSNVTVEGPNATLFRASWRRYAYSSTNPYVRIQVEFVSSIAVANLTDLRATVAIRNNVTGIKRVPIYGES